MEKNSKTSVGFIGLLTLLFIALKLCGVIGWSWWLVLAPILIFPAFLIFLGALALIGMLWLVVRLKVKK